VGTPSGGGYNAQPHHHHTVQHHHHHHQLMHQHHPRCRNTESEKNKVGPDGFVKVDSDEFDMAHYEAPQFSTIGKDFGSFGKFNQKLCTVSLKKISVYLRMNPIRKMNNLSLKLL
jgi:hypothetical protein